MLVAKQNRGLGRGLDSLLGSVSAETSPQTDSKPVSAPVSQNVGEDSKKDKKLPVKQASGDENLDDPFVIAEDNLTIKGVTQREAHEARSKDAEDDVRVQRAKNAPVPMDEPEAEPEDTGMVDIELIEPNPEQPRTNFKKEELEELSDSIKNNGLLQPIVVRKVEDKYQIVAGERRWQACKLAGLERVPVRIIDVDDDEALMLALIENIQRADLNPIEEAYGYKRMMDRGHMTQTQVAQAVSKGRSTIANSLRLLELPEDAQKLLFDGEITAGHARAILSVPTREGKEKLTQKLIEKKLTVREAEAIARLMASNTEGQKKERPKTPKSYKIIARTLEGLLRTDVHIKNSRGRNIIEINFKDEADLERLCHILLDE